MWLLYDIIFILFALVYLPVFFIKLQQAVDKRRLVCDRLGWYSARFKNTLRDKKTIWIHAVSVGEVLAIKCFIMQLHTQFPAYTIVLSTVTPTGNKLAHTITRGIAHVFYFPFDVRCITQHVLRTIRPAILILTETEIWPNVILSASQQHVPIVIVNGRISSQSFRKYYQIQKLLRSVFHKINLFLVQNNAYAKRLRKLGINPERIKITGNMKFDNLKSEIATEETVLAFKRERGFKSDDRIIIAASTHKGEEDIVLDAFIKLRSQNQKVKLLLAPRHIERTPSIVAAIRGKGLTYRLAQPIKVASSLAEGEGHNDDAVYVLNTIGELQTIYAIADVVFMGGSFVDHGGQNPLEAAVYKKSIVTGPSIFNFTDIYTALCARNGVRKLSLETELYESLRELLNNVSLTKTMGREAFHFVQERQGATEKNVQSIAALLTPI